MKLRNQSPSEDLLCYHCQIENIITQPSIYGVIVYFFAMSLVTELLTGQYFSLLTGFIPWPGYPLPC